MKTKTLIAIAINALFASVVYFLYYQKYPIEILYVVPYLMVSTGLILYYNIYKLQRSQQMNQETNTTNDI